MTRYDIKIMLFIVAIVVAAGLAIGYGVGVLTRPDTVPTLAFPADPPAFAREGGSDQPLADGARLPGYEEVYVNDYADLLPPDAEARVRDDLIELYDRTGVEMTVLTIGSMGDYRFNGMIEEFATPLFNAWGIGNADRNDGVLILVSRYDRVMRIELGASYSRARDADMKRVIDGTFLPYFRNEDYQGGIERGVEETIREIAGVYPGEYETGDLQRGWGWIARRLTDLGEVAWVLLVVPVGGGILWIRRYLRRRPRPCPDCANLMVRADEAADDEHLDGGQRLEEYLQSVDYDVWHCPNCAHMEIHGYRSWISSHSVCPQCDYRTLHTTSEVLTPATTSSTGTKRLDYRCRHCDFRDSETRTIPKRSKSGSGSGRSSFGGGSSSGGGASGSW